MRNGVRTGAAFVAALSAALLLTACNRRDELVFSPPDEPAIAAAGAEAKATLPQFWAKFDAKPAGLSYFTVKVGLPTQQHDSKEFIWVAVLRRSQDKVVGTLANDPVDLGDLRHGSQVEFSPSEIVDWSYEKNGKAYGHFTTRAMRQYANAQQRAEGDEYLAPTPLEPESH